MIMGLSAEAAGLAAQPCFHLGGAAPAYLDHPLADLPHGRRDRRQRRRGVLSAAVRPTVILHGVDTERYRPPTDRAAAFAASGLPGKYAIGCFGRVRHQKGTDVFVDAMCRLLPRYPDFSAVIIGAVTVDQKPFEQALRARTMPKA